MHEPARDRHAFTDLNRAFDAALAPLRSSSRPLVVLFSGGVDSALLAWELRDRPGLSLVTIGTTGSPDLRAAQEVASRLELPWVAEVVGAPEITRCEEEIASELAGVSAPLRSVFVALDLAVARAPGPGDLVCGQGADELFLGYAHFRGLAAAPARQRAHDDLDRLLREDWPRTERLAVRRGRTVRAPYLSEAFVTAALRVPVERRLPSPIPKAFFRDFAVARGLPLEIAARPKRAMQFGSGIDRVRRQSAFGRRPGGDFPPTVDRGGSRVI